jgi:hypothetical protein
MTRGSSSLSLLFLVLLLLCAPILLVSAASADPSGDAGASGTITISTYVFALIGIGACVVGSVFSFVLLKILATFKD